MNSNNQKPRIFLSYSWHDSEIADRVENELAAENFIVLRDIRDIGPWESIKNFMTRIRNQDYVILIISSNYLRSPNCMFEVLEIMKEQKYENKLFSFVTPESNIYNPISKAEYIQYWEEMTAKLENAVNSLKRENSIEIANDLRRYKSIEMEIGPFMHFISDRNNPRIADAVTKFKSVIVNRVSQTHPACQSDFSQTDSFDISIEACHYHFLEFALANKHQTAELKGMVGIKKLKDSDIPEPYDLPMIRCIITNRTDSVRFVNEPFIEGRIQLNDEEISGMSFMIKSHAEKTLLPGAKVEFNIHGSVIIAVIDALFNQRVETISFTDNYEFKYRIKSEQLTPVLEYFRKYCLDLDDLKIRHKQYCL